MARVNLSVPDEIKAEMGRLHWVNWSRVFVEAVAEIIRLTNELDRHQDSQHKDS